MGTATVGRPGEDFFRCLKNVMVYIAEVSRQYARVGEVVFRRCPVQPKFQRRHVHFGDVEAVTAQKSNGNNPARSQVNRVEVAAGLDVDVNIDS